MKIAMAQLRPARGDLLRNIRVHGQTAQLAAYHGAAMIVFPELSLTGYEPSLANSLAIGPDDQRLDILQGLSDDYRLVIGVGAPLKGRVGVEIGSIWFRPAQPRSIYSKQILHADEQPYFVAGQQQIVVEVSGVLVGPAICYESLQPGHALQAAALGADVYAACVAKSAKGVEKAAAYYPVIARKHQMTVIMTNSIGPCDNFVAHGSSAAWNSRGEMVIQASSTIEQLLCYDTDAGTGEILALLN